MTISGENVSKPPLRRVGRELVLELVFAPAADALVPVLRRMRVPPVLVLLGNVAAGILGALALARGELVVAALLLQLKTVLDNTDGRLARATGRVTLTGRYLDTEADLVVNALLFGALAYATDQPLPALAAFVALTLLLTLDFNLTELYRQLHGEAVQAPPSSGRRLERLLARVYAAVFLPQDRIVRDFSRRRFERVVARETRPERLHAAAAAYHDGLTVTVLANLGLSTQLAVLGACLVLGGAGVYPWLVLGCVPVVALLQLRRERLARRAIAA